MLIDGLLEELRTGPAPEADQVLGAALEHAEPEWFARLVDLLRARDNDHARAALLGCTPRLAPPLARELQADREKLIAALALAVRLSSPAMRECAVTLVGDHHATSLAYLLPSALRDSVARVRVAAGRTLHLLTQTMCADYAALNPPAVACEELKALRLRLVMTVREALGIYERYPQVEILGAACWLVHELVAPLVLLMNKQRGKAGAVLFRHVPDWNPDFTAEFLVHMLQEHDWCPAAARVLQGWCTNQQVCALLRASSLLENPEIRSSLVSVRRPAWFQQCAGDLSNLPESLRPLAPRWLICSGTSDAGKRQLLESWIQSGTPELQLAAADEIAKLPSVPRPLTEVAVPSDAQAAEPESSASNADAATGNEPPAMLSWNAENSFAALWNSCRKLGPAQRHELVTLLRECAPIFDAGLRARLLASDARDRVLGLQIVSTQALVTQFRHELTRLSEDAVAAIRALAGGVLEESRRHPASEPVAPPESSLTPPAPATILAARTRLNQLLAELEADVAQAANTAFVQELQQIIRTAHADAAPAGQGAAE